MAPDPLLIDAPWPSVLDGDTRTILEQQSLVPFLQRQRWFASKSRDIRWARFTDWARLGVGSQPSFMTAVSLEYTDGWVESYALPLAVLAEDRARIQVANQPTGVLASIAGARPGAIVDGFQDDETCDRLLDAIAGNEEIVTVQGSLRGSRGTSATGPVGKTGERRWARPGGDQSNSIAFVNDAAVIKLFRRIEPDINPEYEVGRFLTERGFSRTPAVTGALEYLRPGLNAATLAVIETAVKHQGSGWDLAMGELGSFYERIAAGGSPPLPFIADAETLGKRTGELHAALASGTSEAFAPEPLDRTAIDAMAEAMIEHAHFSLSLLRRALERLSALDKPAARAVLAAADALRSRFDELRALDFAGQRIRVHGDYHLGQVLRTGDHDFVILDFEGEPGHSIKDRRAKQSPVKDVAGMVRSFGYAAYGALFRFTRLAPDTFGLLEPRADAWQHAASEAFVGGYRATIAAGAAPPRWWTPLLRAFLLDKALYELAYELNHRPDWVSIPLIAIRKTVE